MTELGELCVQRRDGLLEHAPVGGGGRPAEVRDGALPGKLQCLPVFFLCALLR